MSWIFKYLRHSEEVAKQPNSRQAQLNAINAFIAAAKHSDPMIAAATEYPEEFWDADVSGGTFISKRDAGGAMMGRAQRGDIIIAASWDRMFRDGLDVQLTMRDLQKRGVRLICVAMNVDSATTEGRLVITTMVAVAEYQRCNSGDVIKNRTKVLEYNRGIKIPRGLPLGWKYDRRHKEKKKDGTPYAVYVPDFDCRNLCHRIVQIVDQKKLTYGRAALWLGRNGVKNPRAQGENKVKWDYFTVRNRYEAAKGGFPCKDYDKVTGQNSEQLMVPVEVPQPDPAPECSA